jgi:pimeloyl-ACP methyl ester carboxylesterase
MPGSRFLWPRASLRVVNGEIQPRLGQPGAPMGLSRIYLLVHGFNNDRYQAEESYKAFRRRIQSAIPLHLLERVWQFYWPGYEDLVPEIFRSRFKAARVLSVGLNALLYSKQISKAEKFGELLGHYLLSLRARTGVTEIVLIGHSLGCRLILEAARAMLNTGTVVRHQIPAMCLMAAAIPAEHVQFGGRLYQAAGFAANRIVLYSRNDTVLKYAFPLGQTLAADCRMPEAIGLSGNPRLRWTALDETMLTHGEYWSEPVTTPHILRLFGQATRVDLPGLPILVRRLAENTSLPERLLPQHDLA